MYIVLVGPSGKCRKGTAMKQGMPFLSSLGLKVAAESITREALIRELKVSSESTVNPITGDILLHSSLTIFSQELTVFLGYNNQQLMADLSDWYDCGDKWTYRTKNMGTDDITGLWVNLLGATTPELLQTTLPRDAIGGGLTSRIIFVYEQNKGKTVVFPFASKEELELGAILLKDLEVIGNMSGQFKISEDFIHGWGEWYGGKEGQTPPFEDYRFSGYFERRPTHLLKLSIIMSAARSNEMVVRRVDMEKAKAAMHMIEPKMKFTFSGVGRNTASDSVNRVMTMLMTEGRIPLTVLQQRMYHDLDKFALEKVVETMILMGVAYMENGEVLVCRKDSLRSLLKAKEE
jgi:hypothetical protein